MEEYVYYNSLFDIYSELLTDKEKEAFRDYYQEDLSLSEIADEKNISRSAVQKMVKTVLEKLKYYESLLHVLENNNILRETLNSNSIDDIKKKINDILNK